MRYNKTQSQAMADVFRSQNHGNSTNGWYDYTHNVYAPDTFASVYDATSQEYVYADRLTAEQALDFWQDWGPTIERFESIAAEQKRYSAMYREREATKRRELREQLQATSDAENALIATVTFLGENARKHSIENSLCENYERFLDNVIKREANVPEQSTNRTNDKYKLGLREFYRYATRTRAASLTVGVSADGFTTGDGRVTVTNRTDYEVMTENATVPLTFDQAVIANKYASENGWTQGHRAFTVVTDSNNESEGRPSNPRDGQEHDGYTYCSMCDEWHENN